MTVQVSAGSIPDPQFFDEVGILQAPLREVVRAFRMVVELKVVESGRLIQQPSGGGSGHQLLQSCDALPEGEMQRKLDKANQVASAPAAVAVKQILAGVDVERRARFLVQGTQSHELLPLAGAAADPVALLQVLQQREALFELFQILIHGAVSLPDLSVRGV